MKIRMMKSFLCGASIRTGTLIIGWIHFFFTAIAVLAATSFGIMVIPSLSTNETEQYLKNAIDQYTNQSGNANTTAHEQLVDQEVEAAILIIKSIWLITIVFAYINFASTIALLVGTYKGSRMYLIPWLIIAAKNVIFSLITFLIWILFVPIQLFGKHAHPYSTSSEFEFVVGYSVFLVSYCSLWIYAFLTAFTHYRELSYEQSQASKNFQRL